MIQSPFCKYFNTLGGQYNDNKLSQYFHSDVYIINIYDIGIYQGSRVLSSLPLLVKEIQESKQNCKSFCNGPNTNRERWMLPTCF